MEGDFFLTAPSLKSRVNGNRQPLSALRALLDTRGDPEAPECARRARRPIKGSRLLLLLSSSSHSAPHLPRMSRARSPALARTSAGQGRLSQQQPPPHRSRSLSLLPTTRGDSGEGGERTPAAAAGPPQALTQTTRRRRRRHPDLPASVQSRRAGSPSPPAGLLLLSRRLPRVFHDSAVPSSAD
ncbi:Hypothetical predicted protein [Podarcis lilfordi]|uniref:Uncharacterized protein n=1 Tax=Podarcis lilfordi TaxID=74358 RepID=A0AA35LC51_9SAUR|nr:Hypothetical predicted protein [Podarcis lilfordi]